ncbi:MAG: type I 3-dehydroquinate dehydratase [Tyzzerella sp.]|nr:type I 3-dehydroquinate dehydratase [Tyzzerella sp.]
MNPVIVRNVKIGEGIPKICVPIVGVTAEEIINEAKALQGLAYDMVEWRADWFEDVFEFEKVKKVLADLRKELDDAPILFTFRTANEGGEKSIDKEAYLALNQVAAASGDVDLLDVEIFSDEDTVRSIIEYAHDKGVKVVGSNHDFQKTPPQDEIVKRLQKMQELGADILKVAVMPQTKKDVITLLAATEEMVTNYAAQPVVTMSMSGQGVISRLAGEVFGSAITFGAAKKASAPGQIPVGELEQVLAIIHKSI